MRLISSIIKSFQLQTLIKTTLLALALTLSVSANADIEYYNCDGSLFRVNTDAANDISPDAADAAIGVFWGEINVLNNVRVSEKWVKVIRNLMGTEATFFINRQGGDSFTSMSTMFGVQKDNIGVCDNTPIDDSTFFKTN